MKKLSLDALKQRAEAVASEELLATISGGLENSCHYKLEPTPLPQKPDVGPMPNPPSAPSGTVLTF